MPRFVRGLLVCLLGLMVFSALWMPVLAAQPSASLTLHLTLGNPSSAITDPAFPNNYLIERPQYALAYQRDAGIAAWVSWHLESSDIGGTSRSPSFFPDHSLPSGWYVVQPSDYSGSGYDRGHMTPSGDRTSSRVNNDATFLMTNIIPQAPDNNQGPWAQLENDTRGMLASNEVYLISGGWGSKGTIANGMVTVPAATWKVLVILPIGDNDAARVSESTRVIGIWMPNDNGIRSTPWTSFRVSVDYIEAMTGYDFLSEVDPSVEAVVEARVDGNPTATPVTVTPTATTTPATPTATPTTPTALPTATPVSPTETAIPPTATSTAPTVTPVTPTATAPASPTPTRPQGLVFIPLLINGPSLGTIPTSVPPTASATPTATATTAPSPTATTAPTFTATATTAPSPTATATTAPTVPVTCSRPASSSAPNTPIQITFVDKEAETVTLTNVSSQTVDVNGWWICSMTGNQLHGILSGTMAPGEAFEFPSQAGSPIWSNSNVDPAALYNQFGVQIGYRSQ